jgi:hypothetical protein
MVSPVKWGDPAIVRDRFQQGIAKLETTKYLYPMCYRFPPAAAVEFSEPIMVPRIGRSRRSMHLKVIKPRPAPGVLKGSGEIFGDIISPIEQSWEVLQ